MTTPLLPEVWKVARESNEFVGPITITATVDGVAVTLNPANLKFAVLPEKVRPAAGDWTDPVDDPRSTGIGVSVSAVTTAGRYGIWAQITDNPFVPVLEPDQVGWIERT